MIGDRKGFSGHDWLQHPDEIDPVLDLIEAEGVSSYLEIGAFCGDTFHAVGQRLPRGATMVAVDWPQAMKFSPVTSEDKRAALCRVLDSLHDRGIGAVAILDDSRAPHVVEHVRSLGPFDMVFIDADHTLDGVTADWENYGSLGRIVVFHDIAGDDRWSAGPKRLWGAIKDRYRTREFIAPNSRRGIGALWR